MENILQIRKSLKGYGLISVCFLSMKSDSCVTTHVAYGPTAVTFEQELRFTNGLLHWIPCNIMALAQLPSDLLFASSHQLSAARSASSILQLTGKRPLFCLSRNPVYSTSKSLLPNARNTWLYLLSRHCLHTLKRFLIVPVKRRRNAFKHHAKGSLPSARFGGLVGLAQGLAGAANGLRVCECIVCVNVCSYTQHSKTRRDSMRRPKSILYSYNLIGFRAHSPLGIRDLWRVTNPNLQNSSTKHLT